MTAKKIKIELTAEQKAKRADEKAQQKKIDDAVYRLPSSFALITGERLLAKMGVSLSQPEISMQIQTPKSYYHALMYLPAKRTQVRSAIERCRDIQAYGQQKLIHYLFSGEASKEDDESGHETRDAIENARQKMVVMGKNFVVWEEGCLETTDSIFDQLKERAQAWQRTIELLVSDLQKCLVGQGINVDKVFYKAISR